MKLVDRLVQAQRDRQSVLDLLNSSQSGMLGPEIAKLFGWSLAPSASRLQQMADEGELRREREVMTSAGTTRRQSTWRYFALVATTKQADDVIKGMGKNLRGDARAERYSKQVKPAKPGHYVHDSANRPCIPNQGGQGRTGPRMKTYLEANA